MPDQPENDQPDPEKIRYPEDFTDEELDALAPVMVPAFERLWFEQFKILLAASGEAGRNHDREALRTIAGKLRGCKNWAARWNRRLGDLATEKTRSLETAFGEEAATIDANLAGDGPEESDPADDWKKGE